MIDDRSAAWHNDVESGSDDLVKTRDEISEARLEDVPALVAQMERLQQVAARRADVTDGEVDARSPYFGRIVLLEGERNAIEYVLGRITRDEPIDGPLDPALCLTAQRIVDTAAKSAVEKRTLGLVP